MLKKLRRSLYALLSSVCLVFALSVTSNSQSYEVGCNAGDSLLGYAYVTETDGYTYQYAICYNRRTVTSYAVFLDAY